MKKYLYVTVSIISLLLMLVSTACNDGSGDLSSEVSGIAQSNVSSEDEKITLPDIEIVNPTLKVLTHDALATSRTEKTLKDFYGITDVQIEIAPPAEKRTKLLNSILSNDTYDLYWDVFDPPLIMGGYVQEIALDMDSPLWRPVKDSNTQFLWNSNRYYVVPGFARQGLVYYNKSMFDEAGEDYPTDLFDTGEWDWDKMFELARILTIDSNRDGTPDQYGIGWDEPEHILYTTGKHFISFSPDGTAINNIQSPELARAVAFNIKMISSNTVLNNNARQSFGEGKIAMCIGHRWYAYGYSKLISQDEVGVAPLPRDPSADKYYTEEEGGGFYVPKGAPNYNAALAVANSLRYVLGDPSYAELDARHAIENNFWTRELENEYQKNKLIDAGILRNWEGFQMTNFFADIFSRPLSGEPWETVAAEIAPKIDALIDDMYKIE